MANRIKAKMAVLKARWWDETCTPWEGEGLYGDDIHTPWLRRRARELRKHWKFWTPVGFSVCVYIAHRLFGV